MMQTFRFIETEIPQVYLIDPFCSDDRRGKFIKDYSDVVFQKNGIQHRLAEVFYTCSHKGVVRGMHFQRVKQQAKLVRCINGHVWDVIVDLRKNSPTFKKWLGFDLTGDNLREVLVPVGCAHGYLVIEEAIVSYKCDEDFYGEYDDGLRWDDPDIAIQWPLDKVGGIDGIILSDKDQSLQTFKAFMDAYSGF